MMGNATSFYSELLNRIEKLTGEKDQLLGTTEELREKLTETVSKLQEIEAQRDTALENISQVKIMCRIYDACVVLEC